MAERPNIKDILAAARRGGAAQPSTPASAPPPPPEPEPEVFVAEAAEAPEPATAQVAAPAAPLGRPLTLKEKLAAARAGGPVAPAAPRKAESAPAAIEPASDVVEYVAAPSDAPAAPAAPAAPLGRPLTLKEKLAAARRGAGAAPAAPATSGAKPAAAKAAPAAAAKSGAARTLPPLDKMTDPKDLAEALRRAGASKEKAAKTEAAAKAAEATGATPATAKAAAKAATTKVVAPKIVPPKPAKGAVATAASSMAGASRRAFLGMFSWIVVGWTAFALGTVAFSAMLGRFMFPNVLAEPPSTIKVGVPGRYEKGQVNEDFKTEWGFWVVRAEIDGQDEIYALSTICTHLGCPPNWLVGEQKFKCPCHGSGFYITGINFEGPAPRPLERFKVAIGDDGQILVDKSQKYQFELEQWKDPDSFVPV